MYASVKGTKYYSQKLSKYFALVTLSLVDFSGPGLFNHIALYNPNFFLISNPCGKDPFSNPVGHFSTNLKNA